MEFDYMEQTDLFHPHLHVLADANGLSPAWLSRAWKNLTTAFVTHQRELERHEIQQKLRYILKPPCRSMARRAISEIYSSLAGAQLFRAFGNVARHHGLCPQCRNKTQINFGETCNHRIA
ncbi:MAG: hypothetical protein A3J74_05060 [Elusimicrobia bacterium RIFCSPHIGHO2_02_FULL_57_9]|nr:MAG: hypothetical protein A3J74_05060 [Elusimicrobia bacterium RIFCSPHIGHO2_02_FULL_57_9]